MRRNYIYEDAFDKLSPDNEANLRLKMRVQLVNAAGECECGNKFDKYGENNNGENSSVENNNVEEKKTVVKATWVEKTMMKTAVVKTTMVKKTMTKANMTMKMVHCRPGRGRH